MPARAACGRGHGSIASEKAVNPVGTILDEASTNVACLPRGYGATVLVIAAAAAAEIQHQPQREENRTFLF